MQTDHIANEDPTTLGKDEGSGSEGDLPTALTYFPDSGQGKIEKTNQHSSAAMYSNAKTSDLRLHHLRPS